VRDAPALDQVTTSSYQALRKYADALRATDLDGDYPRAASLLREAVALDTTFAMAYRKLGVALGNSGMPRPQIDSALTRAYQYRDRLPERERYLATGTYFASGPGRDRVKAIEAFQQALNADTSDATAVNNLAGIYRARRDLARAESLYRAIVTSSRATQGSFSNYAGTLMVLGKIQQAESVYAEMRKRFPTTLAAQIAPAIFMEMRGQHDSLEQFYRARTNESNPIARIHALGNLAASAQLRGRIREARTLGAQAMALNVARGAASNPLNDSLSSASIAIWYLERPEQGVRALDAALVQIPLQKLPIEQRLGSYANFANTYSLGGRPDKARALLAQLESDLKDPSYRALAQPMMHAMLGEIAIAEKRPLDGIRELWKADSLPDGPVGDCRNCTAAELGRAYDLASVPDSAIANWERFIGDPYARISGSGPSYLPGIYKRLGELYEAKGDVQKAASNYTAFIDLWKNADPELQPKVQDAKKRLERLKGVSGQ
jgi:tetratricopeptide (TPR) repeat protein